jgi:hypothetical protein
MDTLAPSANSAPEPVAAWDDIPAVDWRGGPLDCNACPHSDLRRNGGCEPGRSCMQDAYARRIDRFFRSHRALADQHLDHAYFEVRAIAARYADLFRLPAMIDDPDETVRLQLALRLPQRLLSRLRIDPHREVRIRVAQRLAEAELPTMLRDEDYEVRKTVARRLAPALLPLLMSDSDLQVRCEVARRVLMPAMLRLAGDAAPEVRRIVAERLPAPLLGPLLRDDDWLVRWTVAGRGAARLIAPLRDDVESEVRERAAARIDELARGSLQALSEPEAPHG